MVNLAVAFQSETQIAVTLFFQNALRKFTKIFTANNFSQSIDICYFNLSSERFSIHNKEVNKIRNDIVCVVARHAIVFRCVLIIAPAMFFNISFEIKRNQSFTVQISRLCYCNYDGAQHFHEFITQENPFRMCCPRNYILFPNSLQTLSDLQQILSTQNILGTLTRGSALLLRNIYINITCLFPQKHVMLISPKPRYPNQPFQNL